MKLRVAIAGYGNLGKSLEKLILQDCDLQLEAVFSRRYLDNKYFVPFKDSQQYSGKIDVVLLAMGSHDDIAKNLHGFTNFHTVDSFDTHAEIAAYKTLLQHTKPNKLSLCALGWDPGLLSMIRGLFSIAKGRTATFWGKGISQGHSNALRSVRGVLDAVEITLPNEDAKSAFCKGQECAEEERHSRLCYVACVTGDEERVEKEIREMPHYFAGQKVEIRFCTSSEVRRVKEQTEHAGEVVAFGEGFSANAKLKLQSNTDFTARIMLAYAKAVPQLAKDGFCGALDPFDVPLKYVAPLTLV